MSATYLNGTNTRNVVKISSVSMHSVWGDKAANLARVIENIETAAAEGANLVVMPQTALTSYGDIADTPRAEKMQVVNAEPISGPSPLAVAAVTKRLGVKCWDRARPLLLEQ